jgi:hypothetical protein
MQNIDLLGLNNNNKPTDGATSHTRTHKLLENLSGKKRIKAYWAKLTDLVLYPKFYDLLLSLREKKSEAEAKEKQAPLKKLLNASIKVVT